VNPYLSTALAALEDLRDEIHHQANRQFFQSRTVSYGDLLQQETTVRNALQLLRGIAHPPAFPSEVHHSEQLAG
jgi:hypothetical protein